jgi:AcrR family transcriptional regulator
VTRSGGARPNLLALEDLPPAPRQQRSATRRARLREAGLALFAERGYERVSVGAVARRARLPVGTFYQHYRGKRQLLLSLMDELLARLEAIALALDPGLSRRAAIRSLLTRAWAADVAFLGAYRAWREAVLGDPSLLALEGAIRSWTTGRVRRALDGMLSLSGARSGIDSAALARTVDALCWGLLAEAPHLSRAARARSVDAAAQLIYHAVFRDPIRRPVRQRKGPTP